MKGTEHAMKITVAIAALALLVSGLVPDVGAQSLTCAITTNVTNGADDMTIEFDATRGEYEGVRSAHGDYNVVTVTAVVTNTGTEQVRQVHATLLVAGDFVLDAEERAIKALEPSDLDPGMSGTMSWNVVLVKGPCVRVDRSFEVLVSSENGGTVRCAITVTLEEKGCFLALDLPDDVVGATGQMITVPISFQSAVSDGVESYRLLIDFDPDLLRFHDAVAVGSRTGTGWRGPRTQLLTSEGSPLPDVLMIDDQAIGWPDNGWPDNGWPDKIRFGEEDTLVFLRFEVAFNPDFTARSDQNVKQSRIEVILDRTFPPNRRILSALNSEKEDAHGGASLIVNDGRVTVTSHCAVPLVPSMLLRPNHPNPFNPSTRIAYELKEEMRVQLVVMDLFGRELRVIDEGMRPAGRYDIRFDAENLPGGVYWYQLRSAAGTLSNRMLLLR